MTGRHHGGIRGQTGDVTDNGVARAPIAIRPLASRRRVNAGEHRAREGDMSRRLAVAALCTFSRPPEATTPDHAGTTSTFCINVTFSASTLNVGSSEASSAAAPATCGAAMLVPDQEA